ncbi:MAG: hypothetical protein N3B12_04900 [Armatimonadetes bacterium]|nr:hypothetical protein [Armatimonadota bacterium]
MSENETRSELKWVLSWATAIVVFASIPYIWGLWLTPPGYQFLGLTHNIDDGAVYLSWMRQIADGSITYVNLFTNEPVKARQFNLLFLLMGSVAGITKLPLVWVYHVFRVLLGIGLILTVWQFSKLFLVSENERRLLIPLVGLSAGIGWLLPGHGAPIGPVDNWQPESITFLSIYLNPLFLAALILMLGTFYFLIIAQRTGSTHQAVYAGLFLLILGNIHTYDFVTVVSVWTVYLIVTGIAEKKFPKQLIGMSAIAGCIAAPSLAYQLHLYHIDPIYRARANSPAHSPPIWSFLAGYGLVLVGAIAGAIMLIGRGCGFQSRLSNSRLLIVWSVIGFALPYIPIAQQRKLVMGLHIPLCILCTWTISYALVRLPRSLHRGLLLAFILFTTGSNVGFLSQDINLLSVGHTVTHYAPYIGNDEMAAMQWLRNDRDWRKTIFAPPTFALFTPAFTGHRVYYGHWSETPDYASKLREWMKFANPETSADSLALIVARAQPAYVVATLPDTDSDVASLSRLLDPVFSAGPVTIYRVR